MSRAWQVGACLMAASLLLPAARAPAQTVGDAYTTPPSVAFGTLYRAVELSGLFPDSKTFPDLLPDTDPKAIVAAYQAQANKPGFDLGAFVRGHFSAAPEPAGPVVQPAAPGTHLLDYVHGLWPVLRQTDPTVPAYASLQPLPYPYVVPGGRFREVYYWDSYFTALGLEQDGEHALAVDLLRNFAFEIDRYGHIPNGSRSYYLSRSQPPFFSYLVTLIAARDGAGVLATYLPELRREYEYWMDGADRTAPGSAVKHVVRLPNGTLLNRNWDDRDAPRDESYAEDVATARQSNRDPGDVWRNLRATAASGWDFSSRWLADQKSLASVRTLSILPVDLNSLLVHLEQTLSDGYRVRGDAGLAALFAERARKRSAAIRALMWNPSLGAFTDYLWREGRRLPQITAATVYPLFANVATPEQARAVARTVEAKLLQVGGLATTLVVSGQQWDAPNGWAPLQWLAVAGLRNYGEQALAREIASRWVRKTIAGFEQQAKLVEKYNVTTRGGDEGGGGEYATQIGFGWTNGVLLAMTGLYPALHALAADSVVPAR